MSDFENEYMEMVEDCMHRESKLSQWEGDFIDSIRDQLGDEKTLTTKQIEKLESIWEKVTSRG